MSGTLPVRSCFLTYSAQLCSFTVKSVGALLGHKLKLMMHCQLSDSALGKHFLLVLGNSPTTEPTQDSYPQDMLVDSSS